MKKRTRGRIRGPRLRRYLTVGLPVLLLLCCVMATAVVQLNAAETVASGTSGTVRWTLYDTGELYFEPTEGTSGTLDDISGIAANWKRYVSQITRITTKEGCTIYTGETFERGFYKCVNLTDISGLAQWETGNTTDLYGLFYNCSSLTDLSAIADWDVSNVTDMRFIFYGCESITDEGAAGLSGWDTSGALNLMAAFYQWYTITNLDFLSEWDIGNVVNLNDTFYETTFLTDVSGIYGWDTSSVRTMDELFYGTGAYQIDLSGWDTGALTSISCIFEQCMNLETLDLSGWETSAVTDRSSAFSGCSALSSVTLGSGWTWDDTSSDESTGALPTPYEEGCTGNWVRSDGTAGPYSASDLAASWSASMAGTWVWEAITYTVVYAANGGSGDASADTVSISYGASFLTAENMFEAPSVMYVFTGWNTEASGSGTDYAAGERVKNLTVQEGDTVTLYAQWGEKTWKSEYVSVSENVYDPEETYYDEDGNVLEITSGAQLYPAEDGYEGYWTKLSDDVWMYTFYVQDASLTYYVYEEALTSELAETFTGDYTILNPYLIEDGSDTSAIAVITNEDGTSETGNLSIRKTLVSDSESSELFRIRVTLDALDTGVDLSGYVVYGSYLFTDGVLETMISDGGEICIEGIPAGISYTVEEVLDSEQAQYYSVTASGSLTGTIAADETAEITITNTGDAPQYGDLCITKTVVLTGDDSVSDETVFTVLVTLTDADGEGLEGEAEYGGYLFTDGQAQISISDGQTIVIRDLPAGYHYTIEESLPDGYTVTYTGQTGEITADAQTTVTITNTTAQSGYGSLRVYKQVLYENEEEVTSGASFQIYVTLTDAEGEVPEGTVKIGNRVYEDGVTKALVSDDDQSGEVYAEFTEIPAGYSYMVTEETAEGYTVLYEGQAGEITADETAVCVIRNYLPEPEDLCADLTIAKEIAGFYQTEDGIYTLFVTFGNLEADRTYEVSCSQSAAERNISSFTAGGDGTAEVTLYLAGGEQAVFSDLPVGTTYRVTEEAGAYTAGYVIADANGLDLIACAADANTEENLQLQTQTETIDASDDGETAEEVTVTFTNTIVKETQIKVSKVSLTALGLTDAEDETAYRITAVFTDLAPGGEYAYSDGTSTDYFYADEDGAAYVVLQMTAGSAYTISGIPVGAQYWFVETANEKIASYRITDAADTGQIAQESDANESTDTELSTAQETADEEEEITVTFTNTTYNRVIFLLPSTGGSGIYVFLGASLLIGGLGILWYCMMKRRRSGR